MKIVTKYDMNELVYFKYEGKIYCSMVYGIDIFATREEAEKRLEELKKNEHKSKV